MKKYVALLLCLAMSLTMFVGCGQKQNSGEKPQEGANQAQQQTNKPADEPKEPEYKDSIVYSLATAPTGSYIPVKGLPDSDSMIAELVYASMLTPKPSGELEPYMAEKYEQSADGLTYTFYLNKNAVWSDGEKVTADDVVFTFTLLADPDNEDFFGGDIKRIKGVEEYRSGAASTVEGVKAIDEHTVEITLKEFYAKGIAFIGEMGIMPEHIWKGVKFLDLEKQERDKIEKPVGSGPYLVTEYVADEYVKLEANPNFFLGEPVTKYLYMQAVNTESIPAELGSGSVDIANVTNLSASEQAELDSGNVDLTDFYYDLFQVMRFSPERMPDMCVRQAMVHAIDRQAIVDTLMEGNGTVCNLLMSAGSWAYPWDFEGWEVDIEKAKGFLEEGGYKDVDNDGYVETPSGEPYVLQMIYPNDMKVREQSAVVIQENLKAIGIKIELTSLEFSTFLTYFISGEYDLLLMGNGVDSIDPDPSSFVEKLAFSDEAKDVCRKAAATMDKNERIDLYRQLAQYQMEEIPIVTLYCQKKVMAYNDKLINFEPGTFNALYKVYSWAIEK